jgi:CHAD domain-containing protein
MSVEEKSIRSLLQRVSRQLAKMSSDPVPQNVHQFRTATRRLEAVLSELIPKPGGNERKLRKQLSRLRRRAGRVRDIDVQIAALRSLKMPEEPRRKTQILRALSESRARREKKFLKALDDGTVRQIRRRLRRARAAIQIPKNGCDPLALAARLFAHLARQPGPITEEVLHRYRIEGKRIRYIAELAGKTPEARRWVDPLKRMQDALGDWHDWLTLTQTVEVLVADGVNSALLSALTNITRAKFRDAIHVVAETKAALLAKPLVTAKPAAPTMLHARRGLAAQPAELEAAVA